MLLKVVNHAADFMDLIQLLKEILLLRKLKLIKVDDLDIGK